MNKSPGIPFPNGAGCPLPRMRNLVPSWAPGGTLNLRTCDSICLPSPAHDLHLDVNLRPEPSH